MFGIQHIGSTVYFKVTEDDKSERKGVLTSMQFDGGVDIREDGTNLVFYSVPIENVKQQSEQQIIIPGQSIIEITQVSHYGFGKKYIVMEKYDFGELAYLDASGKFQTICEKDCRVVGTFANAKKEWTDILSKGSGVGFQPSDFKSE